MKIVVNASSYEFPVYLGKITLWTRLGQKDYKFIIQ